MRDRVFKTGTDLVKKEQGRGGYFGVGSVCVVTRLVDQKPPKPADEFIPEQEQCGTKIVDAWHCDLPG